MLIRSLMAGIAGLAVLALSAPVLAQDSTPQAGDSLTSYVWELAEIQTGPNSSAKPDDPTLYTVMFLADGTVSIGADCNRAIGTFTTTGSDLDITVGATTMALCPPESLSNNFLADLDQVVSFVIADNGDLNLALPMDGGFIRLTPSLAGEVWELTQFESSNGNVFTPDNPSLYTIEFLPGGLVAIGSDCNRGRGSYTRNGSEIDMTVLALTRAMCKPGSFSGDFVTFINQVNSLVFADGQLHLALPFDSGFLSFTPEELTPVAPPR
jgi:heat shock protein HslJ